jgi:2,4-dienoyl-CoA reductase-like NADH-dependent reductase (Old Yellow Enzyme family)
MTPPHRVPFRLKTLDDLVAEIERIGVALPVSENLSVFRNPITIGPVTLNNRFAINPMEGFDAEADGTPSEKSIRRYDRFAAGGAPLIWFEATAVVPEGRSNARQFWLHDKNVDAYAALLARTRRIAREQYGHDLLAVLQLTHSGRYSKPDSVTAAPVITQYSGVLDPVSGMTPETPLITDAQLDRLQDDYVHCATLAAQAGFDGVDVKSCHGYLLNELLGSHTREGKYGGAFENRTRFMRTTIARVRDERPNILVTSRMNVYDAIKQPWGFCSCPDDYKRWDLTEAKQLVAELIKLGVPLLNITIGNPYFNSHYNRPYDQQIRGVPSYDEHPLAGVSRFCRIVGAIQQTFPDLPIITGGCAWLRHLMPYVAAGMIASNMATLFAQGRGAFAYPDSVNDILTTGAMNPQKACVTCSSCTELMRRHQPTGCVIRDREHYQL